MSIQDKLQHLEEMSMIDFSKRVLVSPTTLQYSQERRAIQGDAPQSTKLVDLSINSDSVTFFFLTEATQKYGDDHVYQDVEPNQDFRLKTDPSATYEITLKFFNLKDIVKNKHLRLNDVKNWLWETDFQVFSNDPSFQYQGFNKKLSKLNLSLHPWNKPDTGKWDKIHGDALISKHLYDLFLHIKFFINIMAGQLLNKLRISGYVTKPRYTRNKPEKQPISQTLIPAEQEFDQLVNDNLKDYDSDSLEPEEVEQTIDTADKVANNTIQTQAPIQKKTIQPEQQPPEEEENSGVNADITKPQESINKVNKGVLMQDNIRYSRTPNGYEARFSIN